MEPQKYTILKWNGKYGDDARFIIQDNSDNDQTLLTPGEAHNVAWTHKPLTDSPDFANWQDFGNEQVDNLEDVVF